MTEAASPPERTERFGTTVPRLRTLPQARRQWLAQNPEKKTPPELNQLIPEITDIELDNTRSQGTVGQVLHVAAWNLERGRHWRDAVQLIQTHPHLQQVDVWCLSELDYGMVRAQNEHTTRELACALGLNYAYAVEFLQLSIGTPREQALYRGENTVGYHGNAILSRFPLQSVRLLRFPGIEKWYDSFEHRLGGRNALLADIQVGQTPLTVVSTHLESGPEDGAKRTQEGQLILQELATNSGDRPVILGGDLNTKSTAPVIENFRQAGFLVDETNDLSISTYQEVVDGRIQPGMDHIDYVLSRGLKVVNIDNSPAVIMAAYPWEATGKLLSDHAIVTASFAL